MFVRGVAQRLGGSRHNIEAGRDQLGREFQQALADSGLVVPVATTNVFLGRVPMSHEAAEDRSTA